VDFCYRSSSVAFFYLHIYVIESTLFLKTKIRKSCNVCGDVCRKRNKDSVK
jgi:hypothetical protein